MNIRMRILRFVQRYRAVVGVMSVVLLVSAAVLREGHTILALVAVAPVVVCGVVIIIAAAPAIRTLESLGDETVQRFAAESGTDVAAMPPGKRKKLARRWASRSLPRQAWGWIGASCVAAGLIALMVYRQWEGAAVVGALILVMCTVAVLRR